MKITTEMREKMVAAAKSHISRLDTEIQENGRPEDLAKREEVIDELLKLEAGLGPYSLES